MEKVTILVGRLDRELAELNMHGVEEGLKERKIDITRIDNDRLVLETKYTRTAFIYDISQQPLNGVKADAIFGTGRYKEQLASYLKKHKPYDNDIGLTDYIVKAELDGKFREACEACDTTIRNSINTKIGKALREAADESIKEVHPKPLYPKQIYISTSQSTVKTSFMKEWERYLHENGFFDYINMDCDITYNLWRKTNMNNTPTKKPLPDIKNVIFNNPATIVFWADGTKTVVQAIEGDIYDPEKGLAMAMCKKMLGNKHEYYNTFKHWLKKCKEK